MPNSTLLDRTASYLPQGSFQMDIPTGAVTVIAAGTATAGQLFVFRWDHATVKAYVRYIGAKFILTTAYTTAQETACELFLASAFTVDGTNGTAVDCGSTVTGTGKLRKNMAKSVIGAGDVRVADASAITAGTHTLHINAFSSLSGFMGTVGDTIPRSTSGAADGFGTLYDSRDFGYPLVFGEDEGFIIRNGPVMGAVGVGKWRFKVIWDEGTDA
jgi:hypothetical protein